MATCLMACFGQVVRQDGIKVFSRLGGKYLGNIDVDKTSMNALQQVRLLQHQANLSTLIMSKKVIPCLAKFLAK